MIIAPVLALFTKSAKAGTMIIYTTEPQWQATQTLPLLLTGFS